MDYKQIIAAYGSRIFKSGSEEYVPMEYADAFLNDLAKHGHAVIGIEVFEIENGRIKPLLDQIGDWSNVVKTQKAGLVGHCLELSRTFLKEVPRGPTLYANFCSLSPEEISG